jgi:tetratricopeptide (TPR) repeat protein
MSELADNPYPGPRAFQAADHARFFGRDAEIATLTDLWMLNRVTVLTGPAASGKTSLLLAGAYPAMTAQGLAILPPGNPFLGLTFPFATLPEHNPFTLGLLSSWSPDDLPTRLAGLSISDFLRRRPQVSDGPVFAAIDQLDDLLLEAGDGVRARWRRHFLSGLSRALADHPRLHLLLVARTEAAGQLTEAVGGALHEISGLTPQGAVEAVTRAALAAGRSCTAEAAASLVDDLRTTRVVSSRGQRPLRAARVEPALLQVVCRRLWTDLPIAVTNISEWEIREFCDVDHTLAVYCGQVISQVAAEYGLAAKRLRSWLLENFVTDGGAGGVYAGVRDTAGLPNAIPRSLVDRHLLRSQVDDARRYQLLSSRLVEPLLSSGTDRVTAPAAADYLAAAERDLAREELEFARDHAEQAGNAAQSSRERAQAESLLGNLAQLGGNPAEALRHYREAACLLQAAGDADAAACQLAAAGQVLLDDGQLADALRELRTAVERSPNDLGLQTQLALALWQRGDGHAAVAILASVLEIDGAYAQARRARGEILADLGDATDAMRDLDQAVPDRPSNRAARGLALAELGDHTAATREINDAVASARRNGPVLLYAARTFDLAGDRESARQRAREAIDATDPPLSLSHLELARKLAAR